MSPRGSASDAAGSSAIDITPTQKILHMPQASSAGGLFELGAAGMVSFPLLRIFNKLFYFSCISNG